MRERAYTHVRACAHSCTTLRAYTHVRACAHSCTTLWEPFRAPLSVKFPRQEYWSRLSFPTPGNLPEPGIIPTLLTSPALAGRFFITALPGKPLKKQRRN